MDFIFWKLDGFRMLSQKEKRLCSEQCGQDWSVVSSPWGPGPFHFSGGGCDNTTDTKASRN